MPTMFLQRRDILRYDEAVVKQPIFNEEMTKVVSSISHGDIVIVVADEDKPFIKVMLPSGAVGWTRFIHHRLIRIEHAIWAPVEL